MPQKKATDVILYILVLFNLMFLSAFTSYRITLKGEMVTLPELRGMSVEEARKALTDKKLSLVQSGFELHDSLEQGLIISQDPPAASRIKINKVVKVIVSSGKEKTIVPRVVGRSLQAVTQELKDVGLLKGKISHVHTPRYSAGRIIAQYPLPMSEVAKNSRLSMLVSQGEREEQYLMPDLIGKFGPAVITRLRELGFRVGDVRRSYYPGLEAGIIIKQFPPHGFRVQKRNLITLEVSK